MEGSDSWKHQGTEHGLRAAALPGGCRGIYNRQEICMQNVLIYLLPSITESNRSSWWRLVFALLEATTKKLNISSSIPEASVLRINDMTSGYTMAFKPKALT